MYPKRYISTHESEQETTGFVGSSLEDLRSFPKTARSRLGHELDALQNGLPSTLAKPFASLKGVYELRLPVSPNTYRVTYLNASSDTLAVLHCFIKKTQRTSKADVEITRSRLKTLRQ